MRKILLVLVFATLCWISGYADIEYLSVKAWVDGYSTFVLQHNTWYWDNDAYDVPGYQWDNGAHSIFPVPTNINGIDYFPEWPHGTSWDVNSTPITISGLANIQDVLDLNTLYLTVKSGRGKVYFSPPNAGNGYTTRVTIDDYHQAGAFDYWFTLSGKAVPEPISATLFLLGAGAFGFKIIRGKKD